MPLCCFYFTSINIIFKQLLMILLQQVGMQISLLLFFNF